MRLCVGLSLNCDLCQIQSFYFLYTVPCGQNNNFGNNQAHIRGKSRMYAVCMKALCAQSKPMPRANSYYRWRCQVPRRDPPVSFNPHGSQQSFALCFISYLSHNCLPQVFVHSRWCQPLYRNLKILPFSWTIGADHAASSNKMLLLMKMTSNHHSQSWRATRCRSLLIVSTYADKAAIEKIAQELTRRMFWWKTLWLQRYVLQSPRHNVYWLLLILCLLERCIII